MRALRESLGAKVVANVMHLSGSADLQGDIFERSVTQLAESIADTLRRSGLVPVAESGKVFFRQADLDSDVHSIGAKIYAAWSEKPVDLLIYCVQAMEDAREKEKQAKQYEAEYQGRYYGLLKRLSAVRSVRQMREVLGREED